MIFTLICIAVSIIEALVDFNPLSIPSYRDLQNPNNGENSYVDPSSYAYVIFRPFDGNNVNSEEISSNNI